MPRKTLEQKIASGKISLREACPFLGVCYITARKLAAQKKILTIQVGGVLKITVDEIKRYREEGDRKPEPTPEQPTSFDTKPDIFENILRSSSHDD